MAAAVRVTAGDRRGHASVPLAECDFRRRMLTMEASSLPGASLLPRWVPPAGDGTGLTALGRSQEGADATGQAGAVRPEHFCSF